MSVSAARTAALQQNVQVSVLKQAQQSQVQLATKLLDSISSPSLAPSPPGVGTNVNRVA